MQLPVNENGVPVMYQILCQMGERGISRRSPNHERKEIPHETRSDQEFATGVPDNQGDEFIVGDADADPNDESHRTKIPGIETTNQAHGRLLR